jgi:pyruvate dehydrogenase E2 component (dihydrolipoamide acetyltransferase)
MAVEIVMPRLSDSMEEGTILRWLKADGDEVVRGEELVEIETDKANMTYESDQAGTLERVAAEGDTLPVGAPIARLLDGSDNGAAEPSETATRTREGARESDDADGEGASGDGDAATRNAEAADAPANDAEAAQDADTKASTGAQADGQDTDTKASADASAADAATTTDVRAPKGDAGAAGAGANQTQPAGGTGEKPADGDRVKASPLARRLARESGVDLHDVTPSGPSGRIVKADVIAAADATPSEPTSAVGSSAPATSAADAIAKAKGDAETVELTRSQETVARRMAESKATIPDFTLQAEVDMEACVELRAQLKGPAEAHDGGHAPTYNDMVVKACALALREHRRANGSYRDGQLQLYSRVNVGVAVAAEDALVVPTVFDADEKSLGEIARETRRLAERVRDATITPPELGGGTFTVSNLGMFGVRSFTAIINPPQAAIMSVGSLEQRAVVRDGQLAARNTMSLTLVSDHRILFGAEAARFLARVRELLEAPVALTL